MKPTDVNKEKTLPISAVIITFQHADKLDRTLAALGSFIADIVVVDSLSTDDTEQVANKHHARYFRRAWAGYTDQKNFGNDQALHPWVLSLDDDEVVSEALSEAIKKCFEPHAPPYDAINLPFHTYFCGQRIRFGAWNPEWHIRLFRRDLIRWNSDAVHEGLRLEPHHRIGQLNGVVRHYTADSTTQFAAKTESYARLFAKRAAKQGKKATIFKRFVNPIWRFIAEYFFKLGFLDGYFGLFIAAQNARYTYLKYEYLTKTNSL